MPDRETIARDLGDILPEDAILTSREECLVYECDGIVVDRARPDVVVLPRTTEEVAGVVGYAHAHKVPFVPRGAGTGLSGGALALEGGVLVSLARMDRIVEVDAACGIAVVQPGVINLDLTRAVEKDGLFFAPDPSSQGCSTIGGNVAENAGGPHCLMYGQTAAHVLALKVVLPDGRIVDLGSRLPGEPGYDLVGMFLGSEGLFGIATEITVRLLRKREALETLLGVFPSVEAAGEVVTRIMGAGILPVALEMIDRHTMKAVEPFVQAGYPTDAGATLLIEVEGPRAGMDGIVRSIREICEDGGALEVRTARDDDERTRLWEGRKKAFGAHGRLAPNLYVMDGVVPRTRLAEAIRRTEAIAEEYGLQVGHIMHAGDGNLHPNILFDGRVEGETEKAVRAAEEMARACVELGGTITGEHGVGYEKRDLMHLVFSPADLAALERLRKLFDPDGICNPGKVFPTSRSCGEIAPRRILDVGWI